MKGDRPNIFDASFKQSQFSYSTPMFSNETRDDTKSKKRTGLIDNHHKVNPQLLQTFPTLKLDQVSSTVTRQGPSRTSLDTWTHNLKALNQVRYEPLLGSSFGVSSPTPRNIHHGDSIITNNTKRNWNSFDDNSQKDEMNLINHKRPKNIPFPFSFSLLNSQPYHLDQQQQKQRQQLNQVDQIHNSDYQKFQNIEHQKQRQHGHLYPLEQIRDTDFQQHHIQTTTSIKQQQQQQFPQTRQIHNSDQQRQNMHPREKVNQIQEYQKELANSPSIQTAKKILQHLMERRSKIANKVQDLNTELENTNLMKLYVSELIQKKMNHLSDNNHYLYDSMRQEVFDNENKKEVFGDYIQEQPILLDSSESETDSHRIDQNINKNRYNDTDLDDENEEDKDIYREDRRRILTEEIIPGGSYEDIIEKEQDISFSSCESERSHDYEDLTTSSSSNSKSSSSYSSDENFEYEESEEREKGINFLKGLYKNSNNNNNSIRNNNNDKNNNIDVGDNSKEEGEIQRVAEIRDNINVLNAVMDKYMNEDDKKYVSNMEYQTYNDDKKKKDISRDYDETVLETKNEFLRQLNELVAVTMDENNSWDDLNDCWNLLNECVNNGYQLFDILNDSFSLPDSFISMMVYLEDKFSNEINDLSENGHSLRQLKRKFYEFVIMNSELNIQSKMEDYRNLQTEERDISINAKNFENSYPILLSDREEEEEEELGEYEPEEQSREEIEMKRDDEFSSITELERDSDNYTLPEEESDIQVDMNNNVDIVTEENRIDNINRKRNIPVIESIDESDYEGESNYKVLETLENLELPDTKDIVDQFGINKKESEE